MHMHRTHTHMHMHMHHACNMCGCIMQRMGLQPSRVARVHLPVALRVAQRQRVRVQHQAPTRRAARRGRAPLRCRAVLRITRDGVSRVLGVLACLTRAGPRPAFILTQA